MSWVLLVGDLGCIGYLTWRAYGDGELSIFYDFDDGFGVGLMGDSGYVGSMRSPFLWTACEQYFG